jgi:hypothetical protein
VRASSFQADLKPRQILDITEGKGAFLHRKSIVRLLFSSRFLCEICFLASLRAVANMVVGFHEMRLLICSCRFSEVDEIGTDLLPLDEPPFFNSVPFW